MSRFVQEDHKGKPVKAVKDPVKEKPIKAGNEGYDYSNMLKGKKIPTKGGFV